MPVVLEPPPVVEQIVTVAFAGCNCCHEVDCPCTVCFFGGLYQDAKTPHLSEAQVLPLVLTWLQA